jgi:hypothetical protein
MMRRDRKRRIRLLRAYRLGLKHGLAHFKLDEMRVRLERELALLRAEIGKLRVAYSRAREIDGALEKTEREFGTRLQ